MKRILRNSISYTKRFSSTETGETMVSRERKKETISTSRKFSQFNTLHPYSTTSPLVHLGMRLSTPPLPIFTTNDRNFHSHVTHKVLQIIYKHRKFKG